MNGEFPVNLKISRISQTYKSELRSDPTYYRSIAIIPYISKILGESLCNQFGFLF